MELYGKKTMKNNEIVWKLYGNYMELYKKLYEIKLQQ